MSNWGQRDDPSQLSSGERAEHVAAELQAAFGGTTSDVQRVCSLLNLLRQQFSEQAPKNWPADTIKRLWQSIIGALRVAQAPEVQVAACAAVEALGQSCSSCTDLEREPSAVADAVSCVVDTLRGASGRQVQATAVRALLSLSGCLNCRCYYDKATQEVLGEQGAVQALTAVLPRFLAEATAAASENSAQQQQQESSAAAGEEGGDGGSSSNSSGQAVVADIFRALHYTCLLNPANTARLVQEGGFQLVAQGLSSLGRDLNVLEHGAMLLAEMGCSKAAAGAAAAGEPADGADGGGAVREVVDAIVTVANIARLQLQDKYIEVARAAVWSLGRLASYSLGPSAVASAAGSGSTAAGAAIVDAAREAVAARTWPLLSDPVLRVVLSMLQSCHLQDDPLVKHCLDYIAVVAAAAPLQLGTSAISVGSNSAAEDAAVKSPDGDGASGSNSSPSQLLSLLRLATDAVLATARVACDIRLQAVVLRTLHVLLLRFPGFGALQLGSRHAEVVAQVVRVGAAARQTLEQQQASQQQQHSYPQQQAAAQQVVQQHVYASKDFFLVNLFSLTVLGAVSDAAGAQSTAAAIAAANGASVSAYQSHVLACLAGIVRHLLEGGSDSLSYDEPSASSPAGDAAFAAAFLTVGCCRYACHCCFIHDQLRGSDVLAACRAAAKLLVWCGGADGVNAADREGCGALHFLAAGGLSPLLSAFIEAAGPGLDFLRRTRAGANALQLARGRKHTAAVQVLEAATESAARAAQDALLKELEAEGAQEGSQGPPGSRRSGSAASTANGGAGRQQKNTSGGGGGGSGQDSSSSQSSPSHAGEGGQDETRRAREELERKRRAAEEAYEAALEQRRRQLEDEARQQAAEEARLIEQAQAESLRMAATPPPVQPPPPPPVSEPPAAEANAGNRQDVELAQQQQQLLLLSEQQGQQQQQQQQQESLYLQQQQQQFDFPNSQPLQQQQQSLFPAGPMGEMGAPDGGRSSLEASLQAAAAAAIASGAPLPPGMANLLAQLASEQPQQQPFLQMQQQQSAGSSLPPRSSLSSMDEQVTMLHGSPITGGALGMRRVVSRASFNPEDPNSINSGPGGGMIGSNGSDGGAAAAAGLGGLGGLPVYNNGQGGYAGSYSNLLAAAGGMGPMGGPSGPGMDATGLMAGAGGLMGSGGVSQDAGAALHAASLRAMAAAGLGGAGGGSSANGFGGAVDGSGMPMPHGAGRWPSGSPMYGSGPGGYLNNAMGGGAGVAAGDGGGGDGLPRGLQRGAASSNFLAAQGMTGAHSPALSNSRSQQHLAVGGGDAWLGGPPPGSGAGGRGGGSHLDLQGLAAAESGAAAAAAAANHHRMRSGLSGASRGSAGMMLHDALSASGGEMWDLAAEPTRGSSRQLWLGNVHAGLPASTLQALCGQFGSVLDAMVAPGTLSAVVLFARAEDASRAAHVLHGRSIPQLSYEGKSLVVRYCSAGSDGQHGEAGGAPVSAAAGGAGSDGMLGMGLPPGLEAALSMAGLGPGAIEAAMRGLLPPEQQAALHAVLMQVSAAAGADAAAGSSGSDAARSMPPPLPHRGLGGVSSQSHPHLHHLHAPHHSHGHGAVGQPSRLASSSVGDFATLHSSSGPHVHFQTDQHHGSSGGGAGSYGEDAEHGGGGAAGAGSSTGGGGSTIGDLEGGGMGGMGGDGENAVDVPEGKPSRHLWLGNIPLKPNKLAMELLFARFGPLESVRVFPGKTFAFVNFLAPQHAVAAKMALDGQPAPSVTGSKPMVIRYQKDTSTVPANLGISGSKSMSRSSSAQNLTGLTAAASLVRLLDEDMPPEPAVNLSNKLNPNNIHYDRELAARYKRMSKAEKEALWAQDRAMQALGANAAAAAAAVNVGAAGIAGLLDPTNAAAARLLAQAGLGNLAAGLGGGSGNDFLMPRVMSTGALDYLAGGGGGGTATSSSGAAGVGGGGHGGLFRVNTTQSLLGMQQAANAAMMLPHMGASAAAAGGLQGLLSQHGAAAAAAAAGMEGAAAAQALQQQLQAAQQQAALQQQLQQQAALQQQLQSFAAAGGGAAGQALLNNLAMSQALANLSLGSGAGASASAAAAAAQGAAMRAAAAAGTNAASGSAAAAAGNSGGLDWASMQAALANLGLGGAGPSAAAAAAAAAAVQGQQQNAALAALLQQQQQQQLPQSSVQQQQQQRMHGAGGAALAAALGTAFGGADGAAKRMQSSVSGGRMMGVGQQTGLNSGLAGLNPLMDPATAAAAALVGGLQGMGGGAGGAQGLQPGASGAAAARQFKQLPPSFMCPLTRTLMSDPVVAADGITYNRTAIAEWLRQHDASPVTRQPLANKMLTPNVALRNAILAELGYGAGPA